MMTTPDDKFYHAHVTKRVEFAADLWMFRIHCNGEFKFAPGQYATLGVEQGGKRIERPYSIASSPAEDELEFFFELVPQGALTPLLYKLQPGDELLMRKVPKGRFTLDTQGSRTNHLLDLDRHRRRAVRELCSNAIQRVEGRPVRRHAINFSCSMAPAVRGSSDTKRSYRNSTKSCPGLSTFRP